MVPPFLSRLIGLKNFIILAALCAIAITFELWTLRDDAPHHVQAPQTSIPKILWYKLGPGGLSDRTRRFTRTCIEQNPDHVAKFMTDDSADDYVKKTFAARPDIVQTYLGLNIPIIKADMLRYLLLLGRGGIWSDLDVSCEGIPIDEWIPEQYKNQTNLVVGWKFDAGYEEPLFREFATWTIMGKPGLPHMSVVIEDILEGLHNKTRQYNVSIADLTLSMVGDVVGSTGPCGFTFSLLKSLLANTTPKYDITNLREPKLFGDVLILPGYAFANRLNTYEDRTGLGPPLVTHHYAGSWKNINGAELPRPEHG